MGRFRLRKKRGIFYIFLLLQLIIAIALITMALAMLFTDVPLIAVIAFFLFALIQILYFCSILKQGIKAIPPQVIFPIVRLGKINQYDTKINTPTQKSKDKRL